MLVFHFFQWDMKSSGDGVSTELIVDPAPVGIKN